ncbi:MAG: trehalase family glycosidase [Cyanobacteria bacterium P01_D01_bin.36]
MTHPNFPSAERLNKVRKYIKEKWPELKRDRNHLLSAAKDTKQAHVEGDKWIVYVSEKEDIDQIRESLAAEIPGDLKQITLQQLPDNTGKVDTHGLLYLPGDYVVPGGKFNEAYGWDSYFILRGLLLDNEIELAKSLTDQLLYQVVHYGAVLNANRTYFLSRSQPPFLSRMVLEVYERTQDLDWLSASVPVLETYYQYWYIGEHLHKPSGLSQFYDFGDGPAPEVVVSEMDEQGKTHFDRVKEFYRQNEVEAYDVSLYYDREKDELMELFYKGDRTMRESGCDPTDRFGPFSVDVLFYLPVCLNSLLHQMEQDIAEIYSNLNSGADRVYGQDIDQYDEPEMSAEEQIWRERAQQRKAKVNKYLWDEASGLYFDYHTMTGERRQYEFATTFYPLWTGIASAEQAKRVVENLSKFEAPGGVRTSTHNSGNQWDDPMGWAPLQLMAVEGLMRYGYEVDAKRLASRFITMVTEDFERCGNLVEKYHLENCSSEVFDEIEYGYSSNEVGFGWTNGVVLAFLELLDER